jgi:16S rRNA (guanine966-N2)-methyltransferase
MRIAAGRFRGRPLTVPSDNAIRPTSDRVRAAIFDLLAHGPPRRDLSGLRVLDLFAGTGALGFEALSRGAASCLFVDEDAAARGLIRTTVDALGLTGETRVFRRDATALGDAGKFADFDLIFLDPPYGRGLGERALRSALAGGWIAADATVVLEERRDAEVHLPPPLTEVDRRTWGDTQVLFGLHPPAR